MRIKRGLHPPPSHHPLSVQARPVLQPRPHPSSRAQARPTPRARVIQTRPWALLQLPLLPRHPRQQPQRPLRRTDSGLYDSLESPQFLMTYLTLASLHSTLQQEAISRRARVPLNPAITDQNPLDAPVALHKVDLRLLQWMATSVAMLRPPAVWETGGRLILGQITQT